MAKASGRRMDDWPCPGFSAHPSERVTAPRISIDWVIGDRLKDHHSTHQRVLDYTCACSEVAYELLGTGGTYLFRRTDRSAPSVVAYAGPWRWAQASPLWRLLLSGEAR